MKVINPLENFDKAENEVVCFLSGPCPSGNKWRNDIVSFLEDIEKDKTLKLDNLVIINPFRKDWPKTEDGLKEQVKWEVSMLNQTDIFAAYFGQSKDVKDTFPMTLMELGRNMSNIKEKFGNNKINYRILAFAHPDYTLFSHLKFEIEFLTEKWKNPITLESTNKSIMTLASRILESYVKIAK